MIKEQLTHAEQALCRQRGAIGSSALLFVLFKRELARLKNMACTTTNAQDLAAERKFWSTPELVEKLLPFLDPFSVLTLCACFEEETVDRVVAEIEKSWRTEDEWSVLEKILNSAEKEEGERGEEEKELEEEEDWTGLEQFLDLSEYQDEEQGLEILW